jgi:hypothetical protein
MNNKYRPFAALIPLFLDFATPSLTKLFIILILNLRFLCLNSLHNLFELSFEQSLIIIIS